MYLPMYFIHRPHTYGYLLIHFICVSHTYGYLLYISFMYYRQSALEMLIMD